MPLTPGTRLGVFTITAQIGVGGMGEVYRATDSNLKRSVAIKVLPASVAGDADRLARFQREAEVLAALNHPNIAAIYGLERTPAFTALVMELVEGDDLSQRIARLRAPGAPARQAGMPLDEALPIAKQIAEALEAAHEQGIIHRDLKPANIKVRADGTVKVLDFGLAKAIDANASSATADAMNSPTITSPAMTQAGMILGTAAYMSPEQARGRPVDRRADIWAFGAVLFEMLTGQRAFEGEDISVTLANVIKEDPKWDGLPKDLPAPMRRLLRRCLQKDPKKRLSAIGDARLELDEALQPAEAAPVATVGSSLALAQALRRAHVWRGIAIGAMVVAVMAIGSAVVSLRRTAASSQAAASAASSTMTALTSTGNAELGQISPDGKYVAYVQTDEGQQSVWVRQIASGSTVRIVAPVPDLDIRGVTIAPDASFVDVVRGAGPLLMDLWRVPFLGGPARKIIDDVASAPGWSPDGKRIAYLVSVESERRLMMAEADGSQPRVVATRRLPQNYASLTLVVRPDLRPVWFPDGQSIAVVGSDEARGGRQLVRVDVATGAETELRDFGAAIGAASGGGFRAGLALGRDGQSVTLNVGGAGPSQVVSTSLVNGEITRLTNDLATYAGVSAAGDAIVTTRYQTTSGVWLTDAVGRNARQLGRDVPSAFNGLSWAGNTRLLYGAATAGGIGIWSTDLAGGASELVLPGGRGSSASADGGTLVFHKSGSELWRADGDGSHAARIADADGNLSQVTPDGSKVFFMSALSGTQSLWVVDLAGGKARQVSIGMSGSSPPAVSPDGRLVAIVATSPGTLQATAVVMPVDGGEPVRRLPLRFTRLRWTPDGRGLTYADATDTNLWVQPLDGGAPRQVTTFTDGKKIADFAWSPDGQQLAITRAVTTNDIVLLKGVK